MPFQAETMLADVAGSPVTALPGGVEITNKATRRRIDFNESNFCRVQWADNTGGGTTAIRIEYSLDDGANWGVLVPDQAGVNGVNDNDYSEWITVPPDVLNAPYNVLVRAMVAGSNISTKVMYVTIQMR